LLRASALYEALGARSEVDRIQERIRKHRLPGSEHFLPEAEATYAMLGRRGREALLAERPEIDPHLVNDTADRRRCLSLVAWPSPQSLQRFGDGVRQLQGILPGHYFYGAANFHVTILTLIAAREGWSPATHVIQPYHGVVRTVLAQFPPFEVLFEGLALTPSAIIAQGHLLTPTLGDLRRALESELRKVGLADKLEARYKADAAHSVLARFVSVPASPATVVAQMEGMRDLDLGTTVVETVYMVHSDWLMSSDKTRVLHEYPLIRTAPTPSPQPGLRMDYGRRERSPSRAALK
jgi:hypothetical protein